MLHGLISIVTSAALTLPTVPFGADAVRGPTWAAPEADPRAELTRTGPVTPGTAEAAAADEPSYYADGCHLPGPETVPADGCVYGDPEGDTDVWVLGDSKVGQWFPALDEIARREGWRLTVHTKSACPYAPSLPLPAEPTTNDLRCREHNQRLEGLVRQARPDVVVTASGSRGRAVTEAYVRTWRDLRAHGTRQVVALSDTPDPGRGLPGCVEQAAGGDYVEACAYEPGASASPTLESAALQVDGARFVPVADWVCPPSRLSPRCPPVVGRALVYRSGSHLTSTYAATLTDALHARLHRAGVAATPP